MKAWSRCAGKTTAATKTGFSIYRREASADTASVDSAELGSQQASTFSKLGSVAENVTEYEDTTAAPGTLYRYGVTADGEVGSSALVATEEAKPVAAGNRAPSANGQSLSTPEDVPIALTLTGSDPDGDALTYTVVTAPAYGTLSGDAPKLTYTPKQDYSGKDSFTFTVSDGKATSAAATVSITVSAVDTVPVNTAPVANAQELSTEEDTPVTITLTGSDPEGDALSFVVATQPSKGSLSKLNQSTGKVTYTPNENYGGQDSFTFTVSDGNDTSEPATVSINVGGKNDAPSVVAEIPDQSATEDEVFSLDVGGNFRDADGDTLSYTAALAGGGLPGWLTFENGSFSGTPKNGDVGSYNITVTAKDEGGETASDTFTLVVNNVNDAPTIAGDKPRALTVNEDESGTLTLSATDVDQGDSLTWTVSDPAHGSASVTDGAVSYTPDANYSGPDSFTVTVSDGAASDSVEVNVTVEAVNDRPTANESRTEYRRGHARHHHPHGQRR